MTRRKLAVLGLAALLCALATATPAPVLAHHSFAAVFDANQPIELTGTVTRVDWMNPHVWLYLDVKNEEGKVESWAFEMGSPNRLTRYGWHQNSLPEGQVVTIAGSRARDGSLKGAVNTVTLPSGERLFGAQETSR
jgi:hypothetical protein